MILQIIYNDKIGIMSQICKPHHFFRSANAVSGKNVVVVINIRGLHEIINCMTGNGPTALDDPPEKNQNTNR